MLLNPQRPLLTPALWGNISFFRTRPRVLHVQQVTTRMAQLNTMMPARFVRLVTRNRQREVRHAQIVPRVFMAGQQD